MQMTKGEILLSYREAKFKKKQISILAELNLCDRKTIIQILLDGGVDPSELSPLPRYQSGSAYSPAKPTPEPEKDRGRRWVWNPSKCKAPAGTKTTDASST